MIHVLWFHIVYKNIILVKKEIEISIVKDVKILPPNLDIFQFFNFFESQDTLYFELLLFEREDEKILCVFVRLKEH